MTTTTKIPCAVCGDSTDTSVCAACADASLVNPRRLYGVVATGLKLAVLSERVEGFSGAAASRHAQRAKLVLRHLASGETVDVSEHEMAPCPTCPRHYAILDGFSCWACKTELDPIDVNEGYVLGQLLDEARGQLLFGAPSQASRDRLLHDVGLVAAVRVRRDVLGGKTKTSASTMDLIGPKIEAVIYEVTATLADELAATPCGCPRCSPKKTAKRAPKKARTKKPRRGAE